jgi:hypothetical protein
VISDQCAEKHCQWFAVSDLQESMKRSAQWRGYSAIIALAVVVTALPCFAAESAVLRNGFAIRHERRAVIGSMTRLYVSADGASYVDIPTLRRRRNSRLQAPGFRLKEIRLPAPGLRLLARLRLSLAQKI